MRVHHFTNLNTLLGLSDLKGKANLQSKQYLSSSIYKNGAPKHFNSNEAHLKTIEQSPSLKTPGEPSGKHALTTCLKCNTCILVDCNKATENSLVLIRCPKCKTLTKLNKKIICDGKKRCSLLLTGDIKKQFKVINQKTYGMKKKTNGMVAPKEISKISRLQANASCKDSSSNLNSVPIFNSDLVRICCQKCNELINCNDFHDHDICCSTLLNIKSQLTIT